MGNKLVLILTPFYETNKIEKILINKGSNAQIFPLT